MTYQPIWARKKRKNIDSEENSHGKILTIPLCLIKPNPSQPRKYFDQVEIVSLADSIRQHGLLQPISVRKATVEKNSEECYYCVAGERRLRAYRMLGKEEIPAILVDSSPSASAELAIIENIMRKDLTIFEYAEALATLIEKYELTQEELARKMSTSQSNIANKLRLLRFTPNEQKMILENNLSERHARALLRIQDPTKREVVTWHIIEHELTVKETEAYIDKMMLPIKTTNAPKEPKSLYSQSDLCKKIEKTVSFLSKKGSKATAEKKESEDSITYIITIPKSKG